MSHKMLTDLVESFSAALLEKLKSAADKYGYTDEWTRPDWREELTQELARHVRKGDPRDVAAYCAFAWYHGWSVSPVAADKKPETPEFMAVVHARQDAKREMKTLRETVRLRAQKKVWLDR